MGCPHYISNETTAHCLFDTRVDTPEFILTLAIVGFFLFALFLLIKSGDENEK